MKSETMTINGQKIHFDHGRTIIEIARDNGIFIPTLCYLKDASPTGKCGVCSVEIKGAKDLFPACSTPAELGMVVLTDSASVKRSRKQTIAMLLSSGNHNCAIGAGRKGNWDEFQMNAIDYEGDEELCPAWGNCRLQDLAYRYQVTGTETANFPTIHTPKEMINPLIIRNFSRCILCGRCVQACNEIQVNKAIRYDDSGPAAKITAGNDVALKDSDCVFCGECIQVCPVGALVEKKSQNSWRPWDEKKVRTTCPYCGVGCQLWLHVCDGRIVKVTGVEEGAPNKGRLCVKGRFGYDFIYSDERLKTPLIKEKGAFREASWDEALDLVADKFKEIIAQDGPDAVAGVSCARSINEDSYQMQKLFRAVFKTNNIDHCART